MKDSKGRKLVAAHSVFFPAAAAYAAFVVPASVSRMYGHAHGWAGLATPAGHAHELLFGFALAVVAGFLLYNLTHAQLGTLFLLWAVGRVAFVASPGNLATIAADAAFAAMLAWLLAPRFLKAAKKLRNQAFAPILIAITAMAVLFHIGLFAGSAATAFLSLESAVLLFALLMLFMAGRIIAPAAAGHIRISGRHLEARVQPRLEGALLVLMAFAVIAHAVPGLKIPFSLAMAGAAATAAVRLARWRLWWCLGRLDLICLGVGYGWLVAGLALWACSGLWGIPGAIAALHAITAGAMGTLTITVMARVWALKARLEPAVQPEPIVAVAAVGAAAVLRIAWAGDPAALRDAALLWSMAYALLLVYFLRVRYRALPTSAAPRDNPSLANRRPRT